MANRILSSCYVLESKIGCDRARGVDKASTVRNACINRFCLSIVLYALLTLMAFDPANALVITPRYEPGTEQSYGVAVTTYKVGPSGKRSANPIVKAAAVFNIKVLLVTPDGSVKIRLQPVGAVLNGKRLLTPEELGSSISVKLNKYGKAIAVDIPATKYTPAKTVDLQPYMSEDWRNKTWIPGRDIKQGETWIISKQDPSLQKSNGTIRVTLASEKEKHGGIDCCRLDTSGDANVVLEEVIASKLSTMANKMPQSIVNKYGEYAQGITGAGSAKCDAKCWISLEDGGIVAAKSTSRIDLHAETSEKQRSKTMALALESVSQLRRLTPVEAQQFLSMAQESGNEASRVMLCSDTGDSLISGLRSLIPNTKQYTCIALSASVPDILGFSLLSFIDFSIKLHGRILPDGHDYTNMELTLGFKFDPDLPLLGFFDFFHGSGTTTEDLAKSIKPGEVTSGESAALLFVGSNKTKHSIEFGFITSLIRLQFGRSVSLEVISSGAIPAR